MAKNVSSEVEFAKEIDEIEKSRTAIAKLIQKIVDDINNRRVSNPEGIYNALANMFSAIK